MQRPDPFAAQLLDASAPGYARLATERLLARHPELGDRLGARPFEAWTDNLAGRLRDLSIAVSEGRPDLFADQVAWARTAFDARDVSVDHLRASLTAMHEVLSDELPEAAREPVGRCLEQALTILEGESSVPPERIGTETVHGRLASRYVLALLEGDRLQARDLVMEAVDAGQLSAVEAVERICLPAQAELGRMWHLGEISIAEEHFVSATTISLMSQLAGRAERAPRNGKCVLSAALGSDLHDIGLRAVSDLLEIDGWRTVFLGAAVPPEDFVQAVDDFGADLVVLSASLVSHRQNVRATVTAVRRAAEAAGRKAPWVLVGGPAFSDWDEAHDQVGADGCATTASQAVHLARKLLDTEG